MAESDEQLRTRSKDYFVNPRVEHYTEFEIHYPLYWRSVHETGKMDSR